MRKEKIKYALIGCGRISTNHIKAAINNELNIVAVCDIDMDKMNGLLNRMNLNDRGIEKYTDYKKMIKENQDIELIAIATSSGMHAEIARFCIHEGMNVIIEKPIAMSMDDANLIINESNSNNVKVSVCHQNRFNLAIQKTREALEKGRFAKISHGCIHIRWNRNQSYYNQASWRGTWTEDGGCLMNQCIHGIDLLRWMLGEDVESVYGVTRNVMHPYLETEDIGVAILKFKNGAIGTIEGTVNVFPENLEESLFLFGEEGTVKVGGKSTNTIDVWEFNDNICEDRENKGFVEQTSNVYGNGHTSLYADMIDSIRDDRQPYVDAIAGKNALEIVLAIYKSMKKGQAVKLPLEDFCSEDMIGIFTGE